jgi:hypothetical protein
MKRALFFFVFSYQIVVFSQAPALEWVRQYGALSDDDVAVHVDTDLQGNIYLGATLDEGRSDNSLRIAKYSSSGTLVWSRFYTPDFPYFTSWLRAMDVDSAGNVCILAMVDTEIGYMVMVLQKYNSAGTKLWSVTEELQEINIMPSVMVVDKSGGIYVGGTLGYGSYTPNPTTDYIVFKYNKNGNKSWGAMYNGSAGGSDRVHGITVDAAGNCYVTGSAEQQDPRTKLTLKKTTTIKYSSLGFFTWQRHHWHTGAIGGYSHSMAIDGSGNLYLSVLYLHSNYTDYTAYVLKYNSAGTELWNRTVSGLKYMTLPMTLDAGGNCYLGAAIEGVGTRNYNFSTYKYNSAGTQVWNRRFDSGDSTQDIPSHIALDKTGNVYVTGGSYFTKPAPFTLERKPKALTIKYSSSGSQLWMTRYAGTGSDTLSTGTRLALHGSGAEPLVYVAGNTVKVYYGDDPRMDDILLLKYNPAKLRTLNSTLEPIGGVNPVSDYNLNAAPNPFTKSTVIRFTLPHDAHVSLKVYDLLGREVGNLVNGSRNAGSHQVLFDAGHLIAQQYFYTIKVSSAIGEFTETKPLLLRK